MSKNKIQIESIKLLRNIANILLEPCSLEFKSNFNNFLDNELKNLDK